MAKSKLVSLKTRPFSLALTFQSIGLASLLLIFKKYKTFSVLIYSYINTSGIGKTRNCVETRVSNTVPSHRLRALLHINAVFAATCNNANYANRIVSCNAITLQPNIGKCQLKLREKIVFVNWRIVHGHSTKFKLRIIPEVYPNFDIYCYRHMTVELHERFSLSGPF